MKVKKYTHFQNKRLLFLSLMLWAFSALAFQGMAQTRQISGTVTDESSGDALIGANILIDGTSTGTVSDYDGNFTLDIPSTGETTLNVSYTGYQDRQIAVGNQSIVTITLAEGSVLDEVVVVGYGTQKKRDVTGAIATLSSDKIGSLPVSSGVQAMQGQIAGVDIQSSGGRPGQSATFQIRGRCSISASHDPLFVLDGIPQTSGRPSERCEGKRL